MKGQGDCIEVTVSGMTGQGSIRHNNRLFSAANVDQSRTHLNVIFCNEDLHEVYHQLFDEALAAYNAKKKKTRDKIPDYYEHIRQGKQEKLFHEAIFQLGNLQNCGCGTPGGELADAALQEFARTFQERNPHLHVFNMVLHMDEATPHLHVDFVPVATEQRRGLSTRVSMKQALKQQGFVGQGRNMTEWNAWMEREKGVLAEFAQEHDLQVVDLGGGRHHMDLPEYREAVHQAEAIQERTVTAEKEVAELESRVRALRGALRGLEAAQQASVGINTIKPEKTLTGAVKGISVDQVETLKAMALRGVQAEHKVKYLLEENRRLNDSLPTAEERMRAAQEHSALVNENLFLKRENGSLQQSLDNEMARRTALQQGIEQCLAFLERNLPPAFRSVLERAKEFLPVIDEPDRGPRQGKKRHRDLER